MAECLLLAINDAKRRKAKRQREDIAPLIRDLLIQSEALKRSTPVKQAKEGGVSNG